MGPFISLAMTACSRIEINAAMPVTAASLSYTTIVTGLYSNHVKPLCNLQEDLNCKMATCKKEAILLLIVHTSIT